MVKGPHAIVKQANTEDNYHGLSPSSRLEWNFPDATRGRWLVLQAFEFTTQVEINDVCDILHNNQKMILSKTA